MEGFLVAVLCVFSVFAIVELAPISEETLLRIIRGVHRHQSSDFDDDLSFSGNPANLGAEIRGDIARNPIERPVVNVNRNTGASSSSSLSNNVLITKGKNPSLKNAQGLGVAISIRGPMGDATNNTFANTATFGTDDDDVAETFANAGQVRPGLSGTETGTNIRLNNKNPGAPGFASSFNKVNSNIFGSARGNGGQFSNAGAFGQVGG